MFSTLRPLTKYFKIKSVRIYDGIFILHSKLTVTILLAFSFLVSAKQFFGDPIYCKSDEKNTEMVNSYCWTLGTYIMDYGEDDDLDGESISWGISSPTRNSPDTTERIYLRYYQWVVLILLLQSIAFSLPSLFWKNWEGGRLQQLCDELGSAIIENDVYKQKKSLLIEYFTTNYKDVHMCYTIKYIFCECLNFVICIINILMMNVFFNGFFRNYMGALNVLPLYNWDVWNFYSSKIFPKLARCDFKTFGPSGSIVYIDAFCILPLNILNEKIFAFLWCWFLVLTVISGLNVVYRIFLILCEPFRLQLIRVQMRSMSTADIRQALKRSNFGDWFILYKISGNINPIFYRNLIRDLIEYEKVKMDKSTTSIN